MGSILEVAARALEQEREQVRFDQVSSDYYNAYQRMTELQEEIKRVLPPEMHQTIDLLEEEGIAMLAAGTGLCYRQGISDGIRLVIDALVWAPARG